jgi:hypothetical protein
LPLLEWTIVRLVVSENEGRRHDNEMGITGQKEQSLRPNSWAECREKKIGIEPKESTFLLTFLFIGLFRFRDKSGLDATLYGPDERISRGLLQISFWD